MLEKPCLENKGKNRGVEEKIAERTEQIQITANKSLFRFLFFIPSIPVVALFGAGYPFSMTQTREYKVVLYREGMLGSLFLGSSKVDPERFSEFLNRNAAQGWRVVTMEKESRRMLLFFEREAFLVVMEREKQ